MRHYSSFLNSKFLCFLLSNHFKIYLCFLLITTNSLFFLYFPGLGISMKSRSSLLALVNFIQVGFYQKASFLLQRYTMSFSLFYFFQFSMSNQLLFPSSIAKCNNNDYHQISWLVSNDFNDDLWKLVTFVQQSNCR